MGNEPQKVAIFGGAVANGKLTNYMRVLDMSAGRLTADIALKGERPAARMGHAVASIGCNVVVWGGWGHSHLLYDCYQVDMSVRRSTLLVPAVPTETSTLPSSPWLQPVAPKADGKVHIPGRAYHTAAVFGTQIWFFGGSTALGETSDLLVLDLHPNSPATWF